MSMRTPTVTHTPTTANIRKQEQSPDHVSVAMFGSSLLWWRVFPKPCDVLFSDFQRSLLKLVVLGSESSHDKNGTQFPGVLSAEWVFARDSQCRVLSVCEFCFW